jgi:hypothetical protein
LTLSWMFTLSEEKCKTAWGEQCMEYHPRSLISVAIRPQGRGIQRDFALPSFHGAAAERRLKPEIGMCA